MSEQDLDTRIDDALRHEPLRSVPATLLARIQRQVRLLALARNERMMFRARLRTVMAMVGAMACSGAALMWRADPERWATQHYPGFRGYVDYLTLSLSNGDNLAGLVLLAAVAMVVSAALISIVAPLLPTSDRSRRS